jgi:hydrogenase maturation protein HypF
LIENMINKKVNSPEVSSVGRLFDAVSSIIGVRDYITYQGQAAIELEMVANEREKNFYEFDIKETSDFYVINSLGVIKSIVEDIKKRVPGSDISMKFHIGLANLIVDVSKVLRKETGINKVCLSGGVFQNIILRSTASEKLKKNKFKVYNHRKIPPNDGGISAGQVSIAMKFCRGKTLI